MNICFVIGTLQYSGAEKIMMHLMNELYNRGHKISVVLISCDKENEKCSHIVQYPIYNYLAEKNKNKIIRIFNRITRIRRVFKKEDFDIIVSFGSKFNLDVVLAKLFLKIPLILCERNDPKNDPKSKMLRLRRKLSYPLANGFIFQTEEIKSFFSNNIQKKSFVIPNFIEEKIEKNSIPLNKRKVFATSARLDDNQKDQLTLIEAFSEFCIDNDEYTLEIYGEGPDRIKYDEKISLLGLRDKVFLKGRVDKPMKFIKECEVFILSSKYEGMPNALIEAMSYGMPCISTDCSGGGARELIKNNINGLIIPVGDKNDLLEAMKKLAFNEKFREKLGDEAYKINDILNIKKIVSKWEDAFKRFIR